MFPYSTAGPGSDAIHPAELPPILRHSSATCNFVSTVPTCAMLDFMRDPEIIETDLMEISAIADDTVKFERIVAWCASHPDEVPFALHQFLGRRDKHSSETPET